MKFLVVLSCLLAVTVAKPGHVVAPVATVVPSSYGYTYSSHVAAAPVAYAAHHHHVVPTVAAAHSHVVAPTVAAHSHVVAPTVVDAHHHHHHHDAHVVPAVATAHSHIVPAVAHAAVVGLEKTQYHAQDVFGQASYGHSEAFQTHNAVQDGAGNKVGSYSYVAPNGQVFATSYVADALGYRVATNAAPVDTPEVVAARVAHLHDVEVVKHRNRRSPIYSFVGAHPYTSAYAHHHHVYSPIVAHTAYSGHVYGGVPHHHHYGFY